MSRCIGEICYTLGKANADNRANVRLMVAADSYDLVVEFPVVVGGPAARRITIAQVVIPITITDSDGIADNIVDDIADAVADAAGKIHQVVITGEGVGLYVIPQDVHLKICNDELQIAQMIENDITGDRVRAQAQFVHDLAIIVIVSWLIWYFTRGWM